MSAAADQSNFPTMIIPRGTEIRVNNQGQLSIRTPGNLVIQNSGNYSDIESTNGSIRIDENVTVEAVSIRAGQQVKQGDVVGTVGSTGWSTSSHLHYEIRSDLEQNGVFSPIDPRIYILNYQWNNEALLLMQARTVKDYNDLDPLPSAFVGRRRAS